VALRYVLAPDDPEKPCKDRTCYKAAHVGGVSHTTGTRQLCSGHDVQELQQKPDTQDDNGANLDNTEKVRQEYQTRFSASRLWLDNSRHFW